MSLKGLQKGVARAPQLLRQKLSVGEVTTDSNYTELEQTVKRIERQLEELILLSRRYPFCVDNHLKHQVQFFAEYATFFAPIDEADKAGSESSQTVRAAAEYEAVTRALQLEVKPILDSFDVRIAAPARRGVEVIRSVKRTMEKRNHKQLDYDRHRVALKKLQDRSDRSFKEEKNLYKIENEAEHSTQDFHYFNDLLKRELPNLLELEKQFIQPLFSILYILQLDVDQRIHEGMKRVDSSFLDQNGDIEAVFRLRRGDARERTEGLSILHSRRVPLGAESRYKHVTKPQDGSATADIDGAEQPPPYPLDGPGLGSSALNMPNRPSYPNEKEKAAQLDETGVSNLTLSSSGPVSMPAMPPKKSLDDGALASDQHAASLKPREMPAIPPRKLEEPSESPETAIALYPFDAQQPGDLSFDEGDQIEILHRSDSANEWWSGRLKGVQGQFPGNYVSLNGPASGLV